MSKFYSYLKGGIENILKQFVPDLVEKVEAVNG
jgi:hypothetical protein